MIHINKSTNIPKTLVNAPVPTTAEQVSEHYYKAKDVRSQLLADQHNKCCYCECFIEGSYSDVEHYRPKSIYPWLGHRWDNLLFACNICNRSLKNDDFELAANSKRAITDADIPSEEPLIINPAVDAPLDYLEFDRWIIKSKLIDGDASPKGNKTLTLFQLNERSAIVEARKNLYEMYMDEVLKQSLAEAILAQHPSDELAQELLKKTRISIEKYKSPSTPFSGILQNY